MDFQFGKVQCKLTPCATLLYVELAIPMWKCVCLWPLAYSSSVHELEISHLADLKEIHSKWKSCYICTSHSKTSWYTTFFVKLCSPKAHIPSYEWCLTGATCDCKLSKWCLHWCSCELTATDTEQTLHYSFIYEEGCYKYFSGVGLCGDIREQSYAGNL